MKEITLPSGRFAAIRPLTWYEWVLTSTAASFDMRIMIAATKVVTIEGKPLLLDDALTMPMSEANAVIRAVCEEVTAGMPKPEEATAQPMRPTLQ